MNTIFICFPSELLETNLSTLWRKIHKKFKCQYPNAKISSNYTGDGTIDESNSVILIFEYKSSRSYVKVKEKCDQLNKEYVYVSLATIH